jgi:hypothetical protein
MTVLTRNPTNPNFLQPNKFILNFTRLPNVRYFCQSVSVPGISLSETPITNPFVDIYSPGEKAIYDLMNITFMIDEDLKAWLEIHDWIRAMTFPKEYAEYRNLPRLSGKQENNFPQFSDATITLLSSKNNPIYNFKIYDCFPTSLSTFVMSASDSPDTIMTADATFRFAYFDVEKV